MRFYRIGCSERGPLSINRRARFKETQTFSPKLFFCPTNAYLMTKRHRKSTPPRFYIEGKNGSRFDHDMFPDTHPPPQSNTAFDHTERTDDAIVRYFNGSVNQCRRVDHENSPRLHYLTRRGVKGKGNLSGTEEKG